jgi:hypothetical protein
LHAPQLRELFQRGATRLIRHHVLAVTHGLDGQIRTPIWNGGGDDEGNLRMLKESLTLVDARQLWKPLHETGKWARRTVRLPADTLTAKIEEVPH